MIGENFSTTTPWFRCDDHAKTGTHDDAPEYREVQNVGTKNGPPTYSSPSRRSATLARVCKNNQTGQVIAKFEQGNFGSGQNESVTISLPTTDTSYDVHRPLAFDAQGTCGSACITAYLKYNAADLVADGAPAPAINLTMPLLQRDLRSRFDGSGKLVHRTFQSRSLRACPRLN